ncbi:MAG: tRNA (guanine(37)-N(1))-methyltransferase [Microbacterium sp.]|nr:tRNA (guanine(37)-N(1))-methyltransferase [Microbacterium sp.]
MRIDVVTIFPTYFEPLEMSLLGRARGRGLLDLRVHDLREWTHDRHRTVDDTPYGGGAGMVMKPEPWGEALDAVTVDAHDPVILFPSPAGVLFTQAMARELAGEERLVFGCGRYEGIDERVFDYAGSIGRVRLVSLGDYVLNGGEVATMALLEYPGFTKPSTWRGREVPSVLLSGNHGAIARWRREQQLERTRERRPDLLDGEDGDDAR